MMAVRLDQDASMAAVSSARPILRPSVSGEKTPVGIWDLLQWAFRNECARVEFDEVGAVAGGARGFGIEYVLLQQQVLGCRPDGGGTSEPHHDAEIVASAVSCLPEHVGGRAMALQIGDLAKAGRMPDWMPDAQPRVYPVATQTNRWGCSAKTADADMLGRDGWPRQPRRNRKGVIVYDPVKYCPVVIRPTPDQIGRARRAYLAWYGALLELRAT
jgi:hypothetical protein